jgi:hypothetical protein
MADKEPGSWRNTGAISGSLAHYVGTNRRYSKYKSSSKGNIFKKYKKICWHCKRFNLALSLITVDLNNEIPELEIRNLFDSI